MSRRENLGSTQLMGWRSHHALWQLVGSSVRASVGWTRGSIGQGREGKGTAREYSLSDHVRIVARVDLEAAVVGPEVDRRADTGDTALVDLHVSSAHFF